MLFLTAIRGNIVQRICAKSKESYNVTEDNIQNFSYGNEGKEVCNTDVLACYSLWRVVSGANNASVIQIITQGCWETSRLSDCLGEECSPQKTNSQTMFCCCNANFCNVNLTKFEVDVITTTPVISEAVEGRTENTNNNGREKFVLIGAGISLIASLLVLIAFLKRWSPLVEKEINQKTNEGVEICGREIHNAIYTMPNISLTRIVGEGRYGTVWLGLVRGEQIAVKMFPQHYSHYFYNEKDIYTLPFMKHSSLLTYFGSDESRDKDGINRLCLFLSYCPMGTLQEFLRERTMTLSTFCSLAVSTAAGLAHLHTEIHAHGKWKPCITHRDINSRNILVKEDMTCCICDLGLAVKITGPHYYSLGEEMHAETKSINDVGTLRYMAPEVLEGAVNLRDCETSLKQIDVYALGLVLWEMAIRVTDFYHKPTDVLPYMLPFEREVGLHPTLEEMQMAVCRNKARAMFPRDWKCTRASKCIRETIEDCTDQDGEARLTALCVQERLTHIYRATADGGSSPTGNQTNANFSMTILNYNNNYYNNINNCFGHNTDSELTGDRDRTDGGISEGTVETIITHSPSESSSHLIFATECLQPYQGRNPCLERNLLSDSSEEVCIIETSAKDSRETQALISHAPAQRILRPPPPVPYHQNSPFQPLKQTNEELGTNCGTGVVSRFSVPLKKLLGGEGKLTVSPFEPPRPTSLTLFTEEEEARLRELSGRIGTPGDLPPAVRKKRDTKINTETKRFSVYYFLKQTRNAQFQC